MNVSRKLQLNLTRGMVGVLSSLPAPRSVCGPSAGSPPPGMSSACKMTKTTSVSQPRGTNGETPKKQRGTNKAGELFHAKPRPISLQDNRLIPHLTFTAAAEGWASEIVGCRVSSPSSMGIVSSTSPSSSSSSSSSCCCCCCAIGPPAIRVSGLALGRVLPTVPFSLVSRKGKRGPRPGRRCVVSRAVCEVPLCHFTRVSGLRG